MLIKTQIRLVALLPLLFAVLIGAVAWITTIRVRNATQQSELADGLLTFNFELNMLVPAFLGL